MAEERINYNDISSSCSNLTNLASSMSETIESIQSAINQITDPTWDGTAATSYVEKLRSLCNHLPDANRQLAEAVLFLASCADGYKSIDDASLAKLKDLIGGQTYIDNYDVNAAPDIDPNSRVTIEKQKTEEKPKEEEKTKTETETGGATTGGATTSSGTTSGGGYSGYYSGAATTGGIVSASQQQKEAQEKIVEKEKENETETEKVKSLEKGEKVTIPEALEQDEYKTKVYDKDNKFETDSNEESVESIWKSQGSNFEDGLATVKVEGEERYLVKVSPKYGKVGDSIDVNLKDGSVVKCVIAENKSVEGSKANTYGTMGKDSKVNILEFESKTLTEKETIQYPWDNKSSITSISNNGSMLKNKAEATKVIENKTYPVPKTTTTTPDAGANTPTTDSATSLTANNTVTTPAEANTATTVTTNAETGVTTESTTNTNIESNTESAER